MNEITPDEITGLPTLPEGYFWAITEISGAPSAREAIFVPREIVIRIIHQPSGSFDVERVWNWTKFRWDAKTIEVSKPQQVFGTGEVISPPYEDSDVYRAAVRSYQAFVATMRRKNLIGRYPPKTLSEVFPEAI